MAKVGDRFAALELIRRAVKDHFGGLRADVAKSGWQSQPNLHGSQHMSYYFPGEIRWLGMEFFPAFVGEPEGQSAKPTRWSVWATGRPKLSFAGRPWHEGKRK